MKSISSILKFIFKQSKYKLFISLLLFLTSVLQYIQPLITGYLIDGIDLRSSIVYYETVILVTVLLLESILSFIMSIFITRSNLHVEKKLRCSLLDIVSAMNYSQQQEYSVGEIVERLDNDCSTVVQSLSKLIYGVSNTLIDMLILFFLSLSISATLTIVVLLAIPVLILGQLFFGKRVKHKTKQVKMERVEYLSLLQTFYHNFKSEKIVGWKNKTVDRIKSTIDRVNNRTFERALLLNGSNVYSSLLNVFIYSIIVILALHMIYAEKISVGQFIAFNSYSASFFSCVIGLTTLHVNMQSAKVSIDRIVTFYNGLKAKDTKAIPINDIHIQSIDMCDVTVFVNGKHVLKNATLHFSCGTLYVVKGTSGSGKTTLLETLYGIIRTYKGTISVNGYNIKDAPDSFFDKHFSYAFLPPYTVAGSLGDNLSIENIQPDKKDLINKFINSLMLEQAIYAAEKQRDYSFGQKQRISFIRALTKSADVYLLDEITNGVDKPIKEQMLSFIQNLAKSSIVIIVSHDPEVLSMSGNIISIEANGKVYQQSS